MNGNDIIEAFGGLGIMAEITGAKESAARQWRGIGIPSKYWHVLVSEAKRRRIAGITFDAMKNSKPERMAR